MELITDLLEATGYEVVQAPNAEQGISLAKTAQPDLILVDIGLPGMDGLTATRALLADFRTKDIPAVVITAHAMLGTHERALAAGCRGFITKPINTRTFPKTIAWFITLPSSLDITGLSAGVYNLELTASDGIDIATDQVASLNLDGVCSLLTINNTSPVCTDAVADPARIWPPNGKMVSVNVTGVTDGEGDEVTITVDSIRQDEPVVSKGDKKLLPDAGGVGTEIAEVRAERYGTKKDPGNGRVYHIGFTADDGRGGTCTGEVLVGVPHDHKKNDPAVDDGALYDSTVAIPAGAE